MKFTLLLLLISTSLFAQNSIRFQLKDSNKQELPFASAFLKKLPDSTLYKGFLTDENGLGNIHKIPAGNYFLLIQSTGFVPQKVSLPTLTDESTIDLGIITLASLSRELAEVEVRATKPVSYTHLTLPTKRIV